eukprot:10070667-Karenia_brevis.AAC.1
MSTAAPSSTSSGASSSTTVSLQSSALTEGTGAAIDCGSAILTAGCPRLGVFMKACDAASRK